MFEKGADGEAATAAVLGGLPAEWGAIHDVRRPQRRLVNMDHVLVGPGGIFVIDSKNWSGRITVDDGHLRQSTTTLPQMLISRSRSLTAEECRDALVRLDAELRSAAGREGSPAVRAQRPRRTRSRPSRSRRRSVRRGRPLLRLAATTAALLGFVAYWPQIPDAVGGAIAEQITSDLTSTCQDTAASDC